MIETDIQRESELSHHFKNDINNLNSMMTLYQQGVLSINDFWHFLFNPSDLVKVIYDG